MSASWEVREGDALLLLPELPRASVDAIVTSPPYGDQRRYDGTAARVNIRANRGGREPGSKNETRSARPKGPARGVEFLVPFLEAMLPVLTPTGSLALNLGPIMRDGEDSAWEDEEQAVIDLARALGWLVYHTFDSRHSAAGFPDLVLARGGRLLFVELKSEKGTLKADQLLWLDALNAVRTAQLEHVSAGRFDFEGRVAALCPAEAIEPYVWRPSAWPEIEATLR